MGHSATPAMERLQSAPFIPVKSEKDVHLFRPSEVYFSSKDGNAELYCAAFTFVDFGDRANTFLRYCGVRSEPSVKGDLPGADRVQIALTRSDIARLLMRQPERMLAQAGSPDK